MARTVPVGCMLPASYKWATYTYTFRSHWVLVYFPCQFRLRPDGPFFQPVIPRLQPQPTLKAWSAPCPSLITQICDMQRNICVRHELQTLFTGSWSRMSATHSQERSTVETQKPELDIPDLIPYQSPVGCPISHYKLIYYPVYF